MGRTAPLLALSLAVATGCADGRFVAPAAPVARTIDLSVARTTLTQGDSAAVTVRVFDSAGRPIEALPAWAAPALSATTAGILEIRPDRIVAVGPGATQLVAEAGGVSVRTDVWVNPRTISLETVSITLNQVAQRTDGSVPLLEGRAGMLQIFVAADQANFFARPVVRVRLFQGSEEVTRADLRSEGVGLPRRAFEEGLALSWNLLVPAELVRPGLGVLLEVDPDETLPLAPGPRLFPASGEPFRFEFQEVPVFNVRFVPVHHPGGIEGSSLTPENVDAYLEQARRVFPLAEIDRDVRTPYVTSTVPTNDARWIELLGEIDLLRVADGSRRYYVGIALTRGGSRGRASLGRPVSVAYDMLPEAAWIVAHELGHNFDRLHAGPCRPSDPFLDPYYPYAGGTIGTYGFDADAGSLHGRNQAFDIMGVCALPWWVSAYTYQAIFEFRRREAERARASEAATGARVPALLVWGAVGEEGIRLEPAFEMTTVPALPAAAGAYRLEGLDERGAVLFSYSFDPHRISHAPAAAGSFAFALPLTFPVDRLATVQVLGEGRRAELRSAVRPAERALLRRSSASLAGERAERRPGNEVEVRWDPALHRAALLLDPRTGEVLGLARDGVTRFTSDAPELELRLSDGVSSVTRRVRVR